jgi:hypothetical protein
LAEKIRSNICGIVEALRPFLPSLENRC